MRRVRRWQEPVIVLFGVLLAGLLAVLSSLPHTQLSLEVGTDTLPRYVQLSGFHAAEQHGAFPFRWTQGRALVRLPSTEWRRLLRLDVQMVGLPDPQGRPPTVTVFLDQQVLGQAQVVPMGKGLSEPYRYTFLVPARSFLSTQYFLGLESPTLVPGGGDTRALGVAVEKITLTSLPGLGWPPLPTLLAMLAVVPLIYGLGRLFRWPKRTARILAAELVLLLGIALVAAPLDMASSLPYLVGGLAAAGVLAFLVPRGVRRAWPSARTALLRAGTAQRGVLPWQGQRGNAGGLARWVGGVWRWFARIEDGPPLTTSAAGAARSRVPWADLGAIAFLLATTLGFFYQVIFQGQVFWGVDITDFFYPTRAVLGAALREVNPGSLLWTPYIFGGYPLLAEGQLGAFYPLNWLFALSGIPLALLLSLHLIVHYFLAATFTYLYARTLRIGRLGAVLAGLTFAFSGFMISHLGHVSLLEAVAWLPLFFLFAELLLTRGKWLFLILASLVLAMQIYAGHPQAALMGLLALAIYLFFRLLLFSTAPPDQARSPGILLDRRRRLGVLPLAVSNLVRFFAILGLIVVLGLALAGAQLVPLYELVGQSTRAGGVELAWASTYALSGENLPTLVFPFRFGGPPDYVGKWNFAELALYAGIAPLVLALAGLCVRPNRYALLFLCLGGLGLLLALGDETPLFRVLHTLPIYSELRAPGRFVLVVDFSLAMLAGFGVTSLQGGVTPQRRRGWVAFYTALLLLLLVLVVGAGGLGQAVLRSLAGERAAVRTIPAGPPASATGTHVLFLPSLLHQTPLSAPSGLPLVRDLQSGNLYRALPWLLLIASTGLAILAYRWGATYWVTAAFILLLLLDLFVFGQRVNSCMLFSQSDVPGKDVAEVAGFLASRKDEFYVYHVRQLPANELLPWRIASLDGYSPLEFRRLRLYEDQILGGSAGVSLLSLASVRYILGTASATGALERQANLVPIYEAESLRVLENPAALPRALLVSSATVVPEAESLEALARPGWDPAATVLLEDQVQLPEAPAVPVSSAEICHNEGTSVEVRVASTATQLLVLNDSFYPGWKAWVDGTPTTIYRANYLFRAVLVPPGDHTVEFAYRPTSVYVGVAITLLAMLGAIGTLGASALRKRRSQLRKRPR